MISRAGRATIFDRKAFTEAFFDDDAMADGALVVALVGGASYLGALVWDGNLGRFDLIGLLQALLFFVVSWLILGFATWFAASRLFGSTNRYQTLIAMHGLAVLPRFLEIFGRPLSWAGIIWYLAILVLATKEATDLDYRNSGVSVLIGFAVTLVMSLLLRAPFGLLSGVFA
ncbi:MAG TPA: YIP1 family protein [Acidimicrobiia bacterium]|jgi:hypothetical protein|nr:YIP1 family protein [Acidimicrobiia bacterium]